MIDVIQMGLDRPSRRLSRYDQPVKWQCPPSGRVKLNSDAAIFSDGSVGLGFVIRDVEGAMKLAGSKRCTAATDSNTLIEALALRFGLESANKADLVVNFLETDSYNLLAAISQKLLLDTHSMMVDIQFFMGAYESCSASFVNRNANRVAHFLAHFGHVNDFHRVWTNDVPPNCKNIILNDVRRKSNSP